MREITNLCAFGQVYAHINGFMRNSSRLCVLSLILIIRAKHIRPMVELHTEYQSDGEHIAHQ